ncbi:MAG: PAS domain-containing protein [Dongiaceae bacterium]
MVRDSQAVEREDQIIDPMLRQVFAYWQAKAVARGGLPARADIDPVDLGATLPAIGLIEVRRDAADGSGRLRYRVMGSLQVEIMGRDATGELIDLGSAEDDAAAAAIATGHPIHAERKFSPANGVALAFEALVCPLAADGRTVDMLLTAVAPHYQPKDLPAGRVSRFARAAMGTMRRR